MFIHLTRTEPSALATPSLKKESVSVKNEPVKGVIVENKAKDPNAISYAFAPI